MFWNKAKFECLFNDILEHSLRGPRTHYLIIYGDILFSDLLFTTELYQTYEVINWLVDLCLEEMQMTSFQQNNNNNLKSYSFIVLLDVWLFYL